MTHQRVHLLLFRSIEAVTLGLVLVLSACSGKTVLRSDQAGEFLEQICESGASTPRGSSVVEGSVFLRAKSFVREQPSGQFTADLRVSDAQGLIMQVLNPIGGKEAEIKVSQAGVWINGKRPTVDSETASWNGIPLRFATDLFLGRVPCPDASALRAAELGGANVVLVRTPSGDFRYELKQWGGVFFPESLSWSLGGVNRAEFRFEDWDTQARYARKWEARSDSGEIKVKWRERILR